MQKIIVASLIFIIVPLYGYRVQVTNELDGDIAVTLTQGGTTNSYTVAPGKNLLQDTAGCYILTITVISGRAVGQVGGFGDAFHEACRDFAVIARFLISPSWNPATGKEDLEPKILELREEGYIPGF